MNVGFGYDLHPLVKGRSLILGGIPIPFQKGLDGHSDADVLCHAIADAILGGAAMGDIGAHFPDHDPAYRNASSIELLKQIVVRVQSNGYRIVHVDSTVVAEAPKPLPYREAIIDSLASAMGLNCGHVSVKATTNEGFGHVGRGEAIVAYAVVTLEKI